MKIDGPLGQEPCWTKEDLARLAGVLRASGTTLGHLLDELRSTALDRAAAKARTESAADRDHPLVRLEQSVAYAERVGSDYWESVRVSDVRALLVVLSRYREQRTLDLERIAELEKALTSEDHSATLERSLREGHGL